MVLIRVWVYGNWEYGACPPSVHIPFQFHVDVAAGGLDIGPMTHLPLGHHLTTPTGHTHFF